MQIRYETKEDRSDVAMMIARTYLADGARTIEVTGVLRDLPEHDDACAFVAEEEGKPLAYALFTPLTVGEKGKALLLAPVAINTREPVDLDGFLKEVFEKLKAQGHHYVLMHGSAAEYAAMGFENANNFGIDDGLDLEGIDLLIKNISGKSVTETGRVKLPECLK